jgi:lipopolysaccharide export system protein LptA
MTRRSAPVLIALGLALGALPLVAVDQAQAQQNQRGSNRSDPFGGYGGNSRDPIRIDANKLEVLDKENKAIYSGDVVAVRGTAVTRSTVMTIYYENRRGEGGNQPRQANAAGSQEGALKRIEFAGPVSVVNGTQTMTANSMVYDAIAKVVTLRGNATVADGPNVQRGELMTYNTETGRATIVNPNPGGRVQGIFTPGSANEGQTRPRQ